MSFIVFFFFLEQLRNRNTFMVEYYLYLSDFYFWISLLISLLFIILTTRRKGTNKSAFPSMTHRLMSSSGPRRRPLLRDEAPLTCSPVSGSATCQQQRIHQQQPVSHMTSAQPSLSVCLALFPCSPRESRAEWGFTSDRSASHGGKLRFTQTHANATPGATQDHADAGEVGGG